MSTIHAPSGYAPGRSSLLTQADVADLLQVSRWTVTRLIRRGELRGVRVGERLRFRPADIDAYLERNQEAETP